MERQITKISVVLLLGLCMAFISACYYDVEEELYSVDKCETYDMSYSNDIVPILTNNGCLGCHGDLATLDLNGYADLKVYADNGALMGSVRHENGYRAMPDNMPKIDQCDIDYLAAWIEQGAKDN